jgi:hypothetical protein
MSRRVVHRTPLGAGPDRNSPVRRFRRGAGLPVVGHLDVGNRSGVAEPQERPVVGVRVFAVQNGFEVQVASG